MEGLIFRILRYAINQHVKTEYNGQRKTIYFLCLHDPYSTLLCEKLNRAQCSNPVKSRVPSKSFLYETMIFKSSRSACLMPGATGHCQSTALPYKHLRYDY